MKISSRIAGILSAILIATASLHGQAADWSAQIDEIRALLKPADADTSVAKAVKAYLARYPDTWQNLLETGQETSFSEYALKSLGSVDLSAVPDLAEKITALSKSVKEESERRDAAKTAEANALIEQAGETLKTAKKAEDLDALMLTLSKAKISDSENNRKLATISRQLQDALQITRYWQDYLIARETGNAEKVRSNLESISSQLSNTPIVPRSLVLRLLNPEAAKAVNANEATPAMPANPLEEIQSRLAESGDSATALAELKAMPRTQRSNSDESSLLRFVQTIEELRKLEPGMAESEVFANLRNIQNNQGRNASNRAIEQVALNAIARSYGIKTPDAKITSARKVLDSLALTARDAQDWPQLRKVINSLDNLGSGSYSPDSQKRIYDLKIISLLVLGQAAEQRHDLEAAATAYLEASSIDGQYLQREVAYNKLADLKEKSPERIAGLLTKAEENRQRAEAARYAAELESRESRNAMMMNRGMSGERLRREDFPTLRPLVQEVVAEFLKEKRLETPKAADNESKPTKEPAKKSD